MQRSAKPGDSVSTAGTAGPAMAPDEGRQKRETKFLLDLMRIVGVTRDIPTLTGPTGNRQRQFKHPTAIEYCIDNGFAYHRGKVVRSIRAEDFRANPRLFLGLKRTGDDKILALAPQGIVLTPAEGEVDFCRSLLPSNHPRIIVLSHKLDEFKANHTGDFLSSRNTNNAMRDADVTADNLGLGNVCLKLDGVIHEVAILPTSPASNFTEHSFTVPSSGSKPVDVVVDPMAYLKANRSALIFRGNSCKGLAVESGDVILTHDPVDFALNYYQELILCPLAAELRLLSQLVRAVRAEWGLKVQVYAPFFDDPDSRISVQEYLSALEAILGGDCPTAVRAFNQERPPNFDNKTIREYIADVLYAKACNAHNIAGVLASIAEIYKKNKEGENLSELNTHCETIRVFCGKKPEDIKGDFVATRDNGGTFDPELYLRNTLKPLYLAQHRVELFIKAYDHKEPVAEGVNRDYVVAAASGEKGSYQAGNIRYAADLLLNKQGSVKALLPDFVKMLLLAKAVNPLSLLGYLLNLKAYGENVDTITVDGILHSAPLLEAVREYVDKDPEQSLQDCRLLVRQLMTLETDGYIDRGDELSPYNNNLHVIAVKLARIIREAMLGRSDNPDDDYHTFVDCMSNPLVAAFALAAKGGLKSGFAGEVVQPELAAKLLLYWVASQWQEVIANVSSEKNVTFAREMYHKLMELVVDGDEKNIRLLSRAKLGVAIEDLGKEMNNHAARLGTGERAGPRSSLVNLVGVVDGSPEIGRRTTNTSTTFQSPPPAAARGAAAAAADVVLDFDDTASGSGSLASSKHVLRTPRTAREDTVSRGGVGVDHLNASTLSGRELESHQARLGIHYTETFVVQNSNVNQLGLVKEFIGKHFHLDEEDEPGSSNGYLYWPLVQEIDTDRCAVVGIVLIQRAGHQFARGARQITGHAANYCYATLVSVNNKGELVRNEPQWQQHMLTIEVNPALGGNLEITVKSHVKPKGLGEFFIADNLENHAYCFNYVPNLNVDLDSSSRSQIAKVLLGLRELQSNGEFALSAIKYEVALLSRSTDDRTKTSAVRTAAKAEEALIAKAQNQRPRAQVPQGQRRDGERQPLVPPRSPVPAAVDFLSKGKDLAKERANRSLKMPEWVTPLYVFGVSLGFLMATVIQIYSEDKSYLPDNPSSLSYIYKVLGGQKNSELCDHSIVAQALFYTYCWATFIGVGALSLAASMLSLFNVSYRKMPEPVESLLAAAANQDGVMNQLSRVVNNVESEGGSLDAYPDCKAIAEVSEGLASDAKHCVIPEIAEVLNPAGSSGTQYQKLLQQSRLRQAERQRWNMRLSLFLLLGCGAGAALLPILNSTTTDGFDNSPAASVVGPFIVNLAASAVKTLPLAIAIETVMTLASAVNVGSYAIPAFRRCCASFFSGSNRRGNYRRVHDDDVEVGPAPGDGSTNRAAGRGVTFGNG